MAPAWRLTTSAAAFAIASPAAFGVEQQRRRAVDRRQRIAQFVRQHRQEPVLGGVGGLQFGARLLVFRQRAQQVGLAALQRQLGLARRRLVAQDLDEADRAGPGASRISIIAPLAQKRLPSLRWCTRSSRGPALGRAPSSSRARARRRRGLRR